jgi:hypothetical protein
MSAGNGGHQFGVNVDACVNCGITALEFLNRGWSCKEYQRGNTLREANDAAAARQSKALMEVGR